MRKVVVLPAPFGPRKPKISPANTVRSMPETASTMPRRLVKVRLRPRVSMIGPGVSVRPVDMVNDWRSAVILMSSLLLAGLHSRRRVLLTAVGKSFRGRSF